MLGSNRDRRKCRSRRSRCPCCATVWPVPAPECCTPRNNAGRASPDCSARTEIGRRDADKAIALGGAANRPQRAPHGTARLLRHGIGRSGQTSSGACAPATGVPRPTPPAPVANRTGSAPTQPPTYRFRTPWRGHPRRGPWSIHPCRQRCTDTPPGSAPTGWPPGCGGIRPCRW